MIVREGRESVFIHKEGKDTSEVWKYINGAWRIVWQAVRSCFGAGYWRGDRPWIGKDAWKGK